VLWTLLQQDFQCTSRAVISHDETGQAV
jgi:hypothetical protein